MKDEWKSIQRHLGLMDDGIPGIKTAGAIIEALKIKGKPARRSEFDVRTERNLATLLPKAASKFRIAFRIAKGVAARHDAEVKIISGNRSYKEQDALFAKGRTTGGNKVTNAQGGWSRHNFGIAIDFGLFKDGKYLDANNPVITEQIYGEMADEIRPLGIEWGGDWSSFQDFPHFQIATGLTTAQLRERVASNEEIL